MDRRRIYIEISILFLFFGILFFTIRDYGVNWDAPIHYIRGQAYLRYFLTGKDNYSDLPKLRSNYPKFEGYELPPVKLSDENKGRRSIYQYDSKYRGTFQWFLQNDSGHPPLNGILASLFNYIFYQKLGMMEDIESYHLFIVFVSSVLVSVIFLFTAQHYGIFAGFVASISLALYPLFFAESHFNIKDPVETAFYSLTIFAFYIGIIKGKWKWIIISGIFAGLALGTKFNIVFAGFILVAWLTIYYWRYIKRLAWPFSKPLTASLVLFPCIALSILYISWPYLWQNPIGNLLIVVNYYGDIGYNITYQPKDYTILGVFNTYALQWILFTTPLIILFFSTIGIAYTIRYGFKEKYKTSLLIFVWLLVPIIRVSLPSAGIYGGLRQIMEFLPALAILSGIGAHYIVFLLNGYIVKQLRQFSNSAIQQFPPKTILLMLQAICILAFLPITLKLISIHPNENVYFNPLIGGLKGAKERNFPDWGTTLGTVYQQGMDWLNENAEHEANVALVKGLLSNVPRIKIRSDINFFNEYYSAKKKRGEYLMEVIDYRWNLDIPKDKREYIESLMPVYEVKVDTVEILRIWKNDHQHSKATD